jgi:hypothetical protein
VAANRPPQRIGDSQSVTNISSQKILLRLFVLFVVLFVYSGLTFELATEAEGLIIYSTVLVTYLACECLILWNTQRKLFWINPVVLASIFTFVVSFGATNVLYFLPDDLLYQVSIPGNVTVSMNRLMELVILGAVSMWVGHGSKAAKVLVSRIQQSQVLRKWMRSSVDVNMPVVGIFAIIAIVSRLLAIQVGIFGYASSYDQLIAAAAYTQYFSMADGLGKVALLGLALQTYSTNPSRLTHQLVLLSMLTCEVAFGFLSGFKSAVVMPFLIVGVVYASQRGSLPKWLLPSIFVSVFSAYAVIEPFRAARNWDDTFEGTSITSISKTLYGAHSDYSSSDSTIVNILARSNFTYVASLGIEYTAASALPEDSPDFASDLFLAPLHAIIPRFLWQEKSLQTIGLWYTQVIMGLDIVSATGCSPFIYLYFIGGAVAVVVGFLVVGVLQRTVFDGFTHFGGGGLIIVFGLLSALTTIDSAFNGLFVYLIRMTPLLFIVQFLMLKRR